MDEDKTNGFGTVDMLFRVSVDEAERLSGFNNVETPSVECSPERTDDDTFTGVIAVDLRFVVCFLSPDFSGEHLKSKFCIACEKHPKLVENYWYSCVFLFGKDFGQSRVS